MKRLIREPLVHFVILSVLIFVGYGWLTQSRENAERTIYVSEAELERMVALYTTEAGALPSPLDMQAMISDHVEQQALAREARRLGLAVGDTVVERRLAQKMTFMITDLEEVTSPEPGELEAWFETHRDQFQEPQRISFRHVFFSKEDEARIADTLAQLAQAPGDWSSMGDPFMLQRTYSELPIREITRIFGADFAGALADMPAEPARWQGPLKSALGLHIVEIIQTRESMSPELNDIHPQVVSRWQQEVSRQKARAAIAEIVSRYDVEIEGSTNE